ncbi:MAG: hypothetical protein P9L94_05485 [Candidatus Hinthialibacter antarcticus]|nr:hypothetical protein [Candidatus Hinthialibacter antarcticus]
MARGKKSRKTTETPPPASVARPQEVEKKGVVHRRFYFYDYIVVSIFFVAFAYLQKFVTMKFLGNSGLDDLKFEKIAVDFFFDTLWKGFLVVALLVFLHDFFYRDVEDDNAT